MADTTELFLGSPFALTADRRAAESWAGRPEVLAKLERIRFGYGTRQDSSIVLTWANLGAGKTHALLHLGHLLRASKIVPAFVEMPQQPKRFVELYQRIAEELSVEDLVDLASGDGISGELARAVRVLKHGTTSEQQLARSWLSAARPPLRELKAATGLGARIEDDAHACDVLCALVAAFGSRGRRLVVLLDEFQRIGSIQAKQRETMLSHLRSVFSRNPSHFSIVIAVGSRIEKTALDLLPPELRTLMGVQPTISLPEMSRDEALAFLRGRLAAFRPQGYAGDAAAPFGEVALEATVDFVSAQDSARMIPRTLLQALAYLYDQTCLLATAPALNAARVRELLSELRWDT